MSEVTTPTPDPPDKLPVHQTHGVPLVLVCAHCCPGDNMWPQPHPGQYSVSAAARSQVSSPETRHSRNNNKQPLLSRS